MLSVLLANRHAVAGLAAALLAVLTPLSDHPIGPSPAASSATPLLATVDVNTAATTPTRLAPGAGMSWTSGDNTADSATGRLHQQMVGAVAALGVRALRFPSGSFANCYNWRRGVGPVASRPLNLTNWSPSGVVGCYTWPGGDGFGTDEFMGEVAQLSRLEGHAVEPIITVNACTARLNGTCSDARYPPICPDPLSTDLATGCPGALLAADWVEYLNGSTSTKFGAMRAANTGRTAPYGVHWFEIGNELSVAETPAAPRYSNLLRTYATAMRAVDPSIGILAQGDCICGDFPKTMRRDQVLLSTVGSLIDGIAPHVYAVAGDSTGAVDSYLAALQGAISAAGLDGRVAIMPTEWAAMDDRDNPADPWQQWDDQRAAVNDATDMLAFIRRGVAAATFFTLDGNPFQMLHCSDRDPADSFDECAKPQVQPYESIPAQAVRMLSASLGPRTAAVSTTGGVDAAATLGNATVSVDMVNSGDTSMQVVVSVSGSLPGGTATLRGLAGENLAENLARTPSQYPAATTTVVPRVFSSIVAAARMTVTLPPSSVSVLTVPLAGGPASTSSGSPGGSTPAPFADASWWRRPSVRTLC
jgi:alpha-L-arabinofuranosidase